MVKLFPDQLKLETAMKVLLNLFGLFCIMVVCEESDEGETESLTPTLVDKAKAFLESDSITLKIVDKFYELNFIPELKGMMHFSLNHFLVIRELFAHESYNLQKYPDFN